MEIPREAGVHGMTTKLSLPITSSPSPCSTPSPEFSFTISFDSPSTAATGRVIKPSSPSRCDKSLSPSAASMAPADDLFFHGHLIPLQLSSRPPAVSPGGSLDSIDDTTRCPRQDSGSTSAGDTNSVGGGSSCCSNTSRRGESKERRKRKTTSLLRGLGKWWRGNEESKEGNSDGKKGKKKVFDAVGRKLRRYMSAVEPLFSFRSGRDKHGDLHRRPCSFSGDTNSAAVRREEWHRRPGRSSAPASMRASPTNNGILVAVPKSGSSDASTMEELQSAVQAAIAHCKNSIAMKEDACKL